MTTIYVRANDVLDSISEAKCSLEQFQKGNVDVDRHPLTYDEIEKTIDNQICRELLSFVNLLEEFVELSASGYVLLSLEDFKKLQKARRFK